MVVKTTKPETQTALVRRARKINRVLAETYPDAHIERDFQNPFQLVVATVLSAQTTDKRVNLTTPTLFAGSGRLAGRISPDELDALSR